jgi:hypothetical protein
MFFWEGNIALGLLPTAGVIPAAGRTFSVHTSNWRPLVMVCTLKTLGFA